MSIFAACYVSVVQGLPGDKVLPELADSLRQTLDSLESGLDFMAKHIDQTNLDGVIGIRLVEGESKILTFNN